MDKWITVVKYPLGLTGFALFVVLILLTRRQTETQPVWVRASFIVMAFIALLGGLWLEHDRNRTSPLPAEKTSAQQKPLSEPKDQTEISQQKTSGANQIDQKTRGPGSPAIANTGGDVTITITNP